MARTKDTVDIIKALVALCTPTVSITSSVDNLDGTYLLNIPNTYWLRVSKKIFINDIEYKIESFIINESITIKPEIDGGPIPAVNSFTLPAPHFFHGVLEMASIQQAGKSRKASLRTPFVYLYEVLDEEVIEDELELWGRSSKPRLYFMDESKTEWSPEQHKQNAIEPVRQMVELFFTKIADEQDSLYGEVLSRNEFARADWGKFIVDKGNEKKFFADQISGIQSGFNFEMAKSCGTIDVVMECDLLVTVSVTPELTVGADDGTATANDTGGQGTITYLWTTIDGEFTIPGEETKKTATGLAPGTYTVVVSDSIMEDCTATDDGTVEAAIPVLDNALLLSSPVNNVTFTETDSPIEGVWMIDFYSSDFSTLQSLANGSNGNLNIVSGTRINAFSSGNRNFDWPAGTMLLNSWNRLILTTSAANLEGKAYLNGLESISVQGQLKLNRKLLGTGAGGGTPFDGRIDNMYQAGTLPSPAQLIALNNDPNYALTNMNATRAYDFNESGATVILVDQGSDAENGTLNNFPPPPPEYFIPR